MAVTIYALVTPGKMPRAYVGCTKGKLAKRWREHRCLLKSGTHTCRKLQLEWTGNSFVREFMGPIVLEELPDDAALELKRERELHWMNRFSNDGVLYNEHLVSFRPVEEARARGVENARKPNSERMKRIWSDPALRAARSLRVQEGIKAAKELRVKI